MNYIKFNIIFASPLKLFCIMTADYYHSNVIFKNRNTSSFVPGWRKSSSAWNHVHTGIIRFMTNRCPRNGRSFTSCDNITHAP